MEQFCRKSPALSYTNLQDRGLGSAGWGVLSRSSSWKLGIKTVFLPAQAFKEEQILQCYCWWIKLLWGQWPHRPHLRGNWERNTYSLVIKGFSGTRGKDGRRDRVTSLSEILGWLLGIGKGSLSAGLSEAWFPVCTGWVKLFNQDMLRWWFQPSPYQSSEKRKKNTRNVYPVAQGSTEIHNAWGSREPKQKRTLGLQRLVRRDLLRALFPHEIEQKALEQLLTGSFYREPHLILLRRTERCAASTVQDAMLLSSTGKRWKRGKRTF